MDLVIVCVIPIDVPDVPANSQVSIKYQSSDTFVVVVMVIIFVVLKIGTDGRQ